MYNNSHSDNSLNLFELGSLNKYPKLIFTLMYNKTAEELKNFIINHKNNINPTNEVLKTYINEIFKYVDEYNDKLKTDNILIHYNYFFNIPFDEVNKSFEELPKNKMIIFNIGYNNTGINTLYNSVKDANFDFITNFNVLDFKPFEFYNIIKSKEPYNFAEFEKPKSNEINESDKYTIVINYNNDKDIKKCKFTFSSKKYSKRQIDVLLNGGIIEPFNKQSIKIYQRIVDIESKGMIGKINININYDIVRQNYNENFNICQGNFKFNYKITDNDYLNEMFRIYMSNFESIKLNFNYNSYTKYVLDFFGIDK